MKNYIKYAQDAVSGRIVVGELVRLSCQRFLDDLKRKDIEFRKHEADRAIAFASLFHHYTGAHSGEVFKLEKWQEFVVANIVGFYLKGTNRRRYTTSYIEIARKNGKTFLAAYLCIYFAIADGEDGAEALLAANTREQARIAFEMCQKLCEQIDPKAKQLKVYKNEIKIPASASRLKVLAADSSKLDGYNASFGLIDEYHAARESKLRDVIRSSMGMRMRPHLCTITTAGFDVTLPCYALRTGCVDILRSNVVDDSTFAMIFELDEGDDWKDSSTWKKSNPNLGVTLLPQFLREQVQQAINQPADEVGVKTKNLNIWCQSSETWIEDDLIRRSMRRVHWEEYNGKISYAGVDLASVSDLTALALLMENEKGEFIIKMEYYIPSDTVSRGLNAEKFKNWIKAGYIKATNGNVTDYDVITARLMEIQKESALTGVAYDSWNATQWAIDATQRGLPLQPFSQTIGNFNKPTKELQRRLLSSNVVIDYNPVTEWCFSNVNIKIDPNGNEKPSKTKKENKIDGVVAMIQALGLYLLTPRFSGGIV